MAIGDITLTSAMRSNLVSLQSTQLLTGVTQERLSTGKRVNTALDNPTNFFAAQAHTQRANLLNGLKDNISEAIQTIKAADKGVKAITSLIEAVRGVVTQARSARVASTSGTDLPKLATQYNELIRQINNVQFDSSYKGVNFLDGATSMTVNFDESASTTLIMSGFDATSVGLAISGGSTGANVVGTSAADGSDLDTIAELDLIEESLNSALATLRTESATLSANLSILSTRQQFITDMANTLTDGATALTSADMNEEGANMLALQTRQQLGVTALSLSSQANSAILRLFG